MGQGTMAVTKKIEHAAALIAALPNGTASRLLSLLKPADIHQLLANAVAKNTGRSVPVKDAVRQFELDVQRDRRSLLNRDLGQSDLLELQNKTNVLETNSSQVNSQFADGVYSLSFLADLNRQTRCRVLQPETASDIAKALSTLQPEVAADTLDGFDSDLRSTVIQWMTQSEEVLPEDVIQLRLILMNNLNRIQVMQGHSSLTLAISRRRLPTDLLENDLEKLVSKNDSRNSVSMQSLGSLPGMEFLSGLTKNDIQAVLQHTDTSWWAPALKNAPVQVQQEVFDCMAAEPATLLSNEIEHLPEVPPRDEGAARNKIVASALKLASQGEILVGRQFAKAAG